VRGVPVCYFELGNWSFIGNWGLEIRRGQPDTPENFQPPSSK
jgi:hypothetical protein